MIAQVRQVWGAEVPLRSLFEHPTLSGFTAAVQHIQAQQAQSQPLPAIVPTNQRVLSDAQQRQWLMMQLAPESTAYNIPTAIRLKGDLSIESLRQSITQVVSRQDTLRTRYPAINGTAAPKLLPMPEIDLNRVDLSHLTVQAQRTEIADHIQQQAQQPFDLAEGPLWRSQLLRLGDREHILLFTLHHIIADGWSMGVLLEELTAFYQAHQSGEDFSAVFPPLPVSYTDYAVWQKSLDLSDQRDYWKQQLHGIEPLIALPTDCPRPAEPAKAGASYEFRLSQRETAALHRFSRQNRVTLFMTLLAAFKVLLHRYSGLSDLVVGTPIANRRRAELEGLIGLFVNTLVIRTQLKNNPRFTDFLTQVRNVTLAAYSHQDLPFEQLIEALEISRSQSHTPLVQAMVALQAPLKGSSLPGLDWSPLLIESTTAKFDLTLDMRETENGLIGRWEYRSDLFRADTIHRLAGHFRSLLKALPEQGELRVSALPMLSHAEVEQLQSWRQVPSAQPVPKESIHHLFEAQVVKTPEAIALTHSQTKLTYRALNHSANQLAHYLHQQGVRLETPVGIWAVRSPEIIIAILAVLKAGGTYIPLDPHYPIERLTWMVEETQMALLIVGSPDIPVPSAIQTAVPTVDLSDISEKIAACPTTNFSVAIAPKVTPESLAYILYTSGSTGRPKGVCTPHRGVTRLVKSPGYVTLTASDVVLQAAPLTFDASTFEIWGALLNGGRLVLLSAQSPSLEALGQAITSEQVTTLWLTSGLFNLMVDEQLESLRSVRQLLAGGDVLSVSHLRKALEALSNTRIINGYGPTEGTTFTCCHSVTASDIDSTVPIGYPLAHTQVYVLDAALQQVPAGVPGELYIGGAGVARGYLNRPTLTAERFIPNPFYDVRQRSGSEHFYLYKTGDRVRYRADGALEYLGRLDQQVKVRGFRVEPGEVEAALATHPAIRQAAVVVSGENADQKRLVAYLETSKTHLDASISATSVISADKVPATSLKIRQFLLQKLPDYMIPAKFIWLSDLPLTPNGKVDKHALPVPQWNTSQDDSPDNRSSRTADELAIEKTLIETWTALLPADTVGIYDNFFDLGGDSILAMQIVSRASQLGLTLSPKSLFQYQTIAELAAIVQQEDSITAAQTMVAGEVPLAPIQRWFFEQDLAAPHHFNQSLCLALPNDFSREALEGAIAHIHHQHDALRLRFSQTASGWKQHLSEDAETPEIAWFDYAHLSLAEQNRAIARQTHALQTRLNLQDGPLVSVGIFSLGTAQPSQLFMAIHHLVIDGVSWRILLDDLQIAYQAAKANSPMQLAPKTHSYRQWVTELVERANSLEIGGDQGYWQAIAQTQPTKIPQDFQGEENAIESTQVAVATLSPELSQSLLQKVPSVYNTQITDALLTAFTQTLTEWTGHTTALIDVESHGRFSERLTLSRTVGWFTTLYPVSLSFSPADTLADNLKAIKAQLRAVPNQGISYGLLRYIVQAEGLTVTPPISFNYLGQLKTAAQSEFQKISSPASNQAAVNTRPHLIDVNSWIENEQLQVEWTFSDRYHHPKTIEQLANQFISNLSNLIDHCCAQEVAYAPDDFGLARLDPSALETVLSQVSFAASAPADQEVSK